MTTVTRSDNSTFVAVKTDEGYLVDTPIVARIGIQEYRRADGSIRREFRPPDEVFHPEALASAKGKPITLDHAIPRVTSKDAHRVTIGSMLTEGKQDGDHVRADITIYTPDAIGDRRELSLGYTAVLDETPGEWNGERYDAIQRNIRINHLSVVKKGRAGVARLNLDGDEDFSTQQEQQTMTVKVKLDNGLEYDAAPEVSRELDKLRADAAATAIKLNTIPTIEAERDTLKARVDGFAAELDAAKAQGRTEAENRVKLDAVAASLKVDAKDKTERQIKEAVIKAVIPTMKLDGRDDAYVNTAFDMAVEMRGDAAMADQRRTVHTKTDGAPVADSAAAYRAYMDKLSGKEVAK